MAFKEARQNTKKGGGGTYQKVTPIRNPDRGKYELPRNGPQKRGNR